MDAIKQSMAAPVMKYGTAALFAIIGTLGALKLITSDSSSVSLLTLVSVCFFGLLIVFFGNQIDWFDLKNLTVKMRRIEEARREIEEREYRIKEIAIVSADVVAHLAAFNGLMGSRRSHKLDRLWLASRFKRLAAISNSEVGGAAWKYMQAVDGLDLGNPDHKAISVKAWKAAYDAMEKELNLPPGEVPAEDED